MRGTTFDVRTPDGEMSVYEVAPEGPGPRGAILFFMDGLGFRDTLKQMVDRLAGEGYRVILPDLFYRSGRQLHFDPAIFTQPDKLVEVRKLVGTLTPEMTLRDARACLDLLGSRADVDPARIGAVGYCMGGRSAFVLAGALGERIRAAASIHGGGLVTPEPNSPHRAAAGVTARLYFGVAKDDMFCTAEHVEALEKALREAGVRYQLEHYAARHGWAVPDTPVHDPAEAERHYQAITALFRAELAP